MWQRRRGHAGTSVLVLIYKAELRPSVQLRRGERLFWHITRLKPHTLWQHTPLHSGTPSINIVFSSMNEEYHVAWDSLFFIWIFQTSVPAVAALIPRNVRSFLGIACLNWHSSSAAFMSIGLFWKFLQTQLKSFNNYCLLLQWAKIQENKPAL